MAARMRARSCFDANSGFPVRFTARFRLPPPKACAMPTTKRMQAILSDLIITASQQLFERGHGGFCALFVLENKAIFQCLSQDVSL